MSQDSATITAREGRSIGPVKPAGQQTKTRAPASPAIRRGGPTKYDHIAIAGNGIGALTLAARLARSDEYAGRVSLIAPKITESRRLINGASLRGRGADYICDAIGIDHATLLKTIANSQSGLPVAARLTSGMVARRGADDWRMHKFGPWQGGSAGLGRPIMYGVRNSRLVAGMRELMEGLDFAEHYEMIESPDHMRDLAGGTNPLLVNATFKRDLLGAKAPPPKRLCFAAQMPFKLSPSGLKRPLEPGTAFAPLMYRKGRINVGFVTPWADPASPEASWYGIFSRPVSAKEKFDKDAELDQLVDDIASFGRACGLEPVDPEETTARALAPAAPTKAPPRSAPGTLELSRGYGSGVPTYYADGMICAALGGLTAAEAILQGADPDAALRKAIRPFRYFNYLWWFETTKIARAVDMLMRVSVPMAMLYPHTRQMPYWAAAKR